VTRKVTRGVAHILAKKQDCIYMGNLEAIRDWGYAPEYVEFMWKMLQNPQPEDLVMGTGESHTVKELIEQAFLTRGLIGRNMSRQTPDTLGRRRLMS